MMFGYGKINKRAMKIIDLEKKYANLSDDELKAQTQILKNRLNNGESLDEILNDAFAVVREASSRVLGMKHYPEQIIGGIVINDQNIAEMYTGEGKTLVSTLPAYLNALTGEPVHVVTANEYLAKRDAEWMGKVYKFLGLSVGVIYNQQDINEKKQAYQADITYGTSSEFGFDYLRDNMVTNVSNKVGRGFGFALVDEIDSVLIDEAKTPLVISKSVKPSAKKYIEADNFVSKLDYSDFTVNKKQGTAFINENGAQKLEKFYNIENVYDGDAKHDELLFYVNTAIKARFLMERDKDYIVQDGKIVIIDQSTGRPMEGRRYKMGLHTALEVKEGVEIAGSSKTLAKITFQNYFNLYPKLAGMTGTAKISEQEFKGIYHLDVVPIPTHKEIKRKDDTDVFMLSKFAKLEAICEDVKNCYENGQPVLIGTQSISDSEELSFMLRRMGIKHNLLNAKEVEKEARIIAQAGIPGSVTIATNMAGRGTDIKLGGNPELLAKYELERDGYDSEVIEIAMSGTNFIKLTPEQKDLVEKARIDYNDCLSKYKKLTDEQKDLAIELGGLRVIGDGRNESRRVDDQLVGRAGRQGEPGSSIFYMSAEDNLLSVYANDWRFAQIAQMYESGKINWKIMENCIKNTQHALEGTSFTSRKTTFQFDNIISNIRVKFYKDREKIVKSKNIREIVRGMADKYLDLLLERFAKSQISLDEMNKMLENFLLPPDYIKIKNPQTFPIETLKEKLFNDIDKIYNQVFSGFDEKNMNNFAYLKYLVLGNFDECWSNYLKDMEYAIDGVSNLSYAQQDPLLAYNKIAYESVEDMNFNIMGGSIRDVLNVTIQMQGYNNKENFQKTKIADIISERSK